MLEERIRITWLNVYRVRHLCKLAHGYDPIMEGWDQKPFHFNESGSAQRKTLHWQGVPEVPLKECASAVRTRWTATTYASTNPDRFTEYPPLEALFKGGIVVEQRLDDMLIRLCAGGDQGELSFFTAQVGPKGSYRTDHVVEFLRRHLEPSSAGRDWRIIMADFYGPHADTTVFDLCWSRQYVLILIGGGVTGILQVMDTHLHYSLSQRYTELEMLDLLEQERVRPHGCASRSRESCCRDLLAAWRHAPLHEMGKRGWYDNCLANALDGSEDHRGRGTAGDLWHQMGMDRLRDQAIADVDAEWEAGRLRWRDVQRLIEPFPKRGQLDTLVEGHDDEGDPDEVMKGAVAWDDAVGLSDDDLDEDHGAALAAPVSTKLISQSHFNKLSKSIPPSTQNRISQSHAGIRNQGTLSVACLAQVASLSFWWWRQHRDGWRRWAGLWRRCSRCAGSGRCWAGCWQLSLWQRWALRWRRCRITTCSRESSGRYSRDSR